MTMVCIKYHENVNNMATNANYICTQLTLTDTSHLCGEIYSVLANKAQVWQMHVVNQRIKRNIYIKCVNCSVTLNK